MLKRPEETQFSCLPGLQYNPDEGLTEMPNFKDLVLQKSVIPSEPIMIWYHLRAQSSDAAAAAAATAVLPLAAAAAAAAAQDPAAAAAAAAVWNPGIRDTKIQVKDTMCSDQEYLLEEICSCFRLKSDCVKLWTQQKYPVLPAF